MFDHFKNEKGVTAVFVLFTTILVILPLAALVMDFGRLYLARNELQNAADAGALAGAQRLYTVDGNGNTIINTNANKVAFEAATQNTSQNTKVEVKDYASNTVDVQRGHWSFGTGKLEPGFTQSDSEKVIELRDYIGQEELLDENKDFINAVKIITRRESKPIISFLPVLKFWGTIIGHNPFQMQAEAVAYLGFTKKFLELDFDWPLAICDQSLINPATGKWNCTIGKMVSAGDPGSQTGGFTDFCQPCMEDDVEGSCGTSKSSIEEMLPTDCSEDSYTLGNTISVTANKNIGVLNGQANTLYNSLRSCWAKASGFTKPLELILPVIHCEDNGNVDTCSKLVTAVKVKLIWMSDSNESIKKDQMPETYVGIDTDGDGKLDIPAWPTTSEDTICIDKCSSYKKKSAVSDEYVKCYFNCFSKHYNLKTEFGSENEVVQYADYVQKTIYFLLDCEEMTAPIGITGNENYGLIAKIPVLVQ